MMDHNGMNNQKRGEVVKNTGRVCHKTSFGKSKSFLLLGSRDER